MKYSEKAKLNAIRKRVVEATVDFGETLNLPQWESALKFALNEAREVLHPKPANEAEEFTRLIAPRREEHDKWVNDQKVAKWCRQHDVILGKSRKYPWRWIMSDEIPGMIWALPTLRGIPRITNGILVWCEKPDGTTFQGHMDWFMKDLIEQPEGERKHRKASRKQEEQFEELFME